jgi:hypothetical protein
LLPNFDETQIDAIFAEIASPNVDMQQNMYGYNIYRRLLRAGYEAKLHKSDGNFSCITIAADDDYFLEITPIIAKGGAPKPLMSHQAFSGELRELSEQLYGTPGMYRFEASFTLKHNTYDAERAEELGLDREDSREEATIGNVNISAYDFHQFIQGALYSIAKKFDTEVYPQMRSNRRKHF